MNDEGYMLLAGFTLHRLVIQVEECEGCVRLLLCVCHRNWKVMSNTVPMYAGHATLPWTMLALSLLYYQGLVMNIHHMSTAGNLNELVEGM